MKLYSTNNHKNIVGLKEAVLKSLPSDKGLYMPVNISPLPESFYLRLPDLSFNEIGFEVCRHLFEGLIPENELDKIINNAFDFSAPLKHLGDNIFVLELFHGPSMAFKDFGARFMAQLMAYFNRGSNQKITILVATSGDTGGAVASGFHNTEGIDVIILYPSGKVSELQEKQLTTWGDNITSLEVEGSFDDCQAIVKEAFLDQELENRFNLSSANSINIARLIPQSFYYFETIKQFSKKDQLVIAVPSGNFGNLTAGCMARKLGAPINKFIAATNINRVVPNYIDTGRFKPQTSLATISNAMDVGNPSNFGRFLELNGSTWNNLKENIEGYSLNDEETRNQIIHAYANYNYICDPHGAIAYGAIQDYLRKHSAFKGVFLETAHPCKFIDTVEETLQTELQLPPRLAQFQKLDKSAIKIDRSYQTFKEWMLNSY